MSAIFGKKKESLKGNKSKVRSGYLTTTEFARLCGVSRFTIINWTKRGRIKAIKTAGGHYRISETEALSLLGTYNEKNKNETLDSEENRQAKEKKAVGEEECRKCLTNDHQDKQENETRKNFLYNFGYGIGRGVQILKERR